jgi:hypothetical protein
MKSDNKYTYLWDGHEKNILIQMALDLGWGHIQINPSSLEELESQKCIQQPTLENLPAAAVQCTVECWLSFTPEQY